MKGDIVTTQYINGLRNTACTQREFAEDTANRETHIINLYPRVAFQRIDGFGGAVTEAVGETLKAMPPRLAEGILQNYFGPEGIGYRMIRTSIDSCDFSLSHYAAVEDAADTLLESFSLARDEGAIIPVIREACRLSGESLPVMLTPWSPPAFMKTNGARNGGGRLKKESYGLWAQYICRYILEYRKHGMHVTMLSVQNEPNAVQTWDSCVFSAEEEKEFLRDHLHPALMRNGLEDIGLYIWDHNKERLYDRAAAVIDPVTAPMIAGLAFHWYSGDHFEALDLVRRIYPEKKLIFSEGCIEYGNAGSDNPLRNAQRYAHDMIGNFKCGMNAFIDWNIVLNENGGPNHAGNFCEAPIMYNTAAGTVIKNPSFFYIGHFSRHIMPGAVRIATTQYSPDVEVVAFQNPDGNIAVILFNPNPKGHQTFLRIDGRIMPVEIPGESISTVTVV